MTVAGKDTRDPNIEPDSHPIEPDAPDRRASAGPPERPSTEAVCPYLMAASGGWRSASPHREHRCGAVDPAASLTADKQRRLCLSLAHQTCSTYGAARGARAAAIAPGVDPAVLAAIEAGRRPVARSAPVILEHPRITSPRAGWPLDRAVSQAALVGLMVIAFALVAIARLSTGDAGAAVISPSTAPSVASATGTPSPTPIPTPSPSASAAAETGSPAPSATSTPQPTFRTTYTVRSGDTLIGIASTYGMTVQAIKNLNGLTSNSLHIGQKLKIP